MIRCDFQDARSRLGNRQAVRGIQDLRRQISRRRASCRQGTTIVVVLCVISITLAMSYAIMRSQGTALQIQANSRYRSDARLAAVTGVKIALRKMHETSWTGVGTAIAGNLSDADRYEASYATGDSSLESSDEDYWQYPYRVTINVTGFSTNPLTGVTSTHPMRAVVQLAPRSLSSEPGNWAVSQPYTVYQWDNTEPAVIHSPVRIEGPIQLNGAIELNEDYPADNNRPFDGSMRDVIILQGAMSSTHIATIYSRATAQITEVPAIILSVNNAKAWWRLDEAPGATVAIDQFGSHHGTYAGASPGAIVDAFGQSLNAVKFDGYNDYINVGGLDISGNAMTILAWFNADSFAKQTAPRIVSKATSKWSSETYWLLGVKEVSSKMRLRFRLFAGGSHSTLYASTGDVLTGQPVFAAAVYDGSKMRLYLNGNLVGSMSKSGNIETNPSVPVFIGDTTPGSARVRYLRDLEAMRVAGISDYRPLTGPVRLNTSITDELALSFLQDDLGVTVTSHADPSVEAATHPGEITTYQLYPGGPSYNVASLTSSFQADQALEPDILTNPLGIFYRKGPLTLGDNTTIRGTIISEDGSQVELRGNNLKVDPVLLPDVEGLSAVVQLPVVISGDDIQVIGDVQGEIHGLLFAKEEFLHEDSRNVNRSLTITGKIVTKNLSLEGRSWDLTTDTWTSRLWEFTSQATTGSLSGALSYFPNWLEKQYSMWAKPPLTIKPESVSHYYHWQDWSQPLFVPHPDDPGLRWDLLEWTDVD